MKTVLEDYIKTDTKGLMLLDMPTGSGKTHSIIEYIAHHIDTLKASNRKIIFITTLKKNLPIKDLEKRLAKYSKSHLFESEVLYVQNSADVFVEHFEGCKHSIKEIFPNYDCSSVQSYLKALDDPKLNVVIRGELGKKSGELARLIRQELTNTFSAVEDRIKAIQQEPKWQWVSKLFPASLTTEYSVLFMSVSRFVYPYHTLVRPIQPLHELLQDFHTTLFIDEVDASKQYVQNFIIVQSLKYPMEPIPTVRQIASRHRESNYPSNLVPPHTLDKQPVAPEEIEQNLKQQSQQLVDDFHLHLSIKSSGDNDQHAFIFYDKSTHHLADANKKILTIQPDFNHNNLWIHLNKKDKAQQDKQITLGKLLSQTQRYLNFFSSSLYLLSNNYYYQRRQTAGIGFDDAAATYLDFYHLPDATKKQLLNEISYQRIAKDWSFNKNMSPRNDSKDVELLDSNRLYEKGFVYHSIQNSESHAAHSKVQSYNFPCTAELLFLNWCRHYMVVGVSATANIPSRLGNYDLYYLKSSLQQEVSAQYFDLSETHRLKLERQFLNSKSGYNKIDIHTHWHGLRQELNEHEVKAELLKLFKVNDNITDSVATEDDIEALIHKVQTLHSEDSASYYLKQYFKIFELWVAYLTQDISAFLLLFSKGYKKERDLITEFCQLLVEVYLPEQRLVRKVSEEIVTIVGSDSPNKIEETKSALARGEKRFVLSTYTTLGAGINIQYPIPKHRQNELVQINAFEASDHTDFDALYLDKPTNVLVNTYGKGMLSATDLVRHIYQLEYLKVAGLTKLDFHNYLQRAFLSYLGRASGNYIYTSTKIHQMADYKLHVMQILIQAVGRICRTNMKSPTIHLHLDNALVNVWYEDLRDMPLLPEFKHISQAIEQKRRHSNILNDAIATQDMLKVRDAIYLMLERFTANTATAALIKQWQFIREICLRSPQLEYLDDTPHRFLYTNFEQPRAAYFYTQKSDYREVSILKDRQPGALSVSEQSARLNKLMSHSGLKAYFEKQGYATTLSVSKHWLQPILFNNIYKGALGEVCGAYLWHEYGLPKLKELPSHQYEIFDFMVTPDIFVDFKHWSKNFKDGEHERDRIFKKMDDIGATLLFVINILEDYGSLSYQVINSENNDKKIVEIPQFMFEGLPDMELINTINNKISEAHYADQ